MDDQNPPPPCTFTKCDAISTCAARCSFCFESFHYCGYNHLIDGDTCHLKECSERRKSRFMLRVADICEELYVMTLRKFWHGGHSRVIEYTAGYIPQQYLSGAANYDMARLAITLSVLPVCWLLEGQDVKVRSWYSQPVVALYSHGPLPNPFHNVFFTMETNKVLPDPNRVVVNLSASYYGHTTTIQQSSTSFQHQFHNFGSGDFGDYFRLHREQFLRRRYGAYKTEELLLELAIRIACNAVYDQVQILLEGYKQRLLTMDDEMFGRWLSELSSRLDRDLHVCITDKDFISRHQNFRGMQRLLDRHQKIGYDTMWAAYQR